MSLDSIFGSDPLNTIVTYGEAAVGVGLFAYYSVKFAKHYFYRNKNIIGQIVHGAGSGERFTSRDKPSYKL